MKHENSGKPHQAESLPEAPGTGQPREYPFSLEAQTQQPVSGTASPQSVCWICPCCGTRNGLSAAFCGACGTSRSNRQEPPIACVYAGPDIRSAEPPSPAPKAGLFSKLLKRSKRT